jgi:hypothetical protein
MRERHKVYVTELDKDVLYEAKFKNANTEDVTGKRPPHSAIIYLNDLLNSRIYL